MCTKNHRLIICLFLALFFCGTANAGFVSVGPDNNDSESDVADLLGVDASDVMEIGKFEDDLTSAQSDFGYDYNPTDFKDMGAEAIAGTITANPFPGTSGVTHYVAKNGDGWGLYETMSPFDGPQGWDVSDINGSNSGLSHLTLYKVVPEPGGLAMALLGMLGAAHGVRRPSSSRSTKKSR